MAEGLKRGDVVLVAIPGDYGKPRPAIVVQSDLLAEATEGLIVCPVTSELTAGYRTRPRLEPSASNGLGKESQVMSDKITTVAVRKVGPRIGRLDRAELGRIDLSLGLVLGLR